jgi:hypothetical protein
MIKKGRPRLGRSAARLLADIARQGRDGNKQSYSPDPNDIEVLMSADLVTRAKDNDLEITAAGLARLARAELARHGEDIDPFAGQHLTLARRKVDTAAGPTEVAINDSESPLAWLARRKGRDGRALIEPVQLQAGERLRAEFTRAQLMPRTTSNWSTAGTRGRRGFGDGETTFTEAVIAARQRVRNALDAVGPEFAGLLLDVCCFLKGLEDVERERAWPPRSAKIVLQLALDRLARHYGFGSEARGLPRAPIRTWLAPGAAFLVED